MTRRLPLLPLSDFIWEAGAILAVALALGAILFWMWISTPTAPATHIDARILKLTLDLSQKWVPTYAVMDLALAGGRQLTLRTPYEPVVRCKVGDTIHLTERSTMAGVRSFGVDPRACGNQALR